MQNSNEKASMRTINILSVVIPLVVAVLLGIRIKIDLGSWTKILPHLNAVFNSTTALCLLIGVYFIKKKDIAKHQIMMTISFCLGGAFLVCYVLYHLSNPSTTFGGEGKLLRGFYYFNLITHIIMSLVVLPFVLRAMYFSLTKQFELHKKTTKFAFPIWLYVSISGVIAYLMISPYYV